MKDAWRRHLPGLGAFGVGCLCRDTGTRPGANRRAGCEEGNWTPLNCPIKSSVPGGGPSRHSYLEPQLTFRGHRLPGCPWATH